MGKGSNAMLKIMEKIKYAAFLNLGILLMAVGIYFFKAPNGFATGGVSGLSIILANIFPFTTQADSDIDKMLRLIDRSPDIISKIKGILS